MDAALEIMRQFLHARHSELGKLGSPNCASYVLTCEMNQDGQRQTKTQFLFFPFVNVC